MPQKLTPLTKFSSALETKYVKGPFLTGFSYLERATGYIHVDQSTDHLNIIFVLSGKIKISYSIFSNKVVENGHAILIPKGERMEIEMLSNSSILCLVFDTPIIKTQVRLLKHVCSRAFKTEYTFVALQIDERIKELATLIIHFMKDHRVSNMSFYEHLNSLIFMSFISYYDWNTIADFFHPLLDSKLDFKTFIWNNYMEADRNVNKLITLSKLPESTFHKKFKEEFGTSAKQWMMDQEAELLLSEAGKKDATPAMLVERLQLNNLAQLRLICKKYYDCSPTKFIERFPIREK